MDKRGRGSVRRCDFYDATTEHVTLEMTRLIARSDLHERFRTSAAEMTFMELFNRIWPAATDADRKMVTEWTKLYDACAYLSTASFQGTHHDLKQIFNLLDLDGSQTLSMSEMVRARILTKDEARNLLKSWNKQFDEGCDSHSAHGKRLGLSLGFSDFCLLMQKPLTDKYGQKEEGNNPADSWDLHCRSAFQASKKKVSLKAAGSAIKTVNALGGFRRNALKPSGFAKTAISMTESKAADRYTSTAAE